MSNTVVLFIDGKATSFLKPQVAKNESIYFAAGKANKFGIPSKPVLKAALPNGEKSVFTIQVGEGTPVTIPLVKYTDAKGKFGGTVDMTVAGREMEATVVVTVLDNGHFRLKAGITGKRVVKPLTPSDLYS